MLALKKIGDDWGVLDERDDVFQASRCIVRVDTVRVMTVRVEGLETYIVGCCSTLSTVECGRERNVQ